MTDRIVRWLACVVAPLCPMTLAQAGQIASFEHVVLIVQENRTPDNLFHGLCTKAGACSTTPAPGQYNVQTANWLNKAVARGMTQPFAEPLNNSYDLSHAHTAYLQMCDASPRTGLCRMDGAINVQCTYECVPYPQFAYVDNSTGQIDPYITLVTQYGWANYMFQTNQGPSFPAHQFLFGATSAPSAADDHAGRFSAENMGVADENAGCAAPSDQTVALINPNGIEDAAIFPCFEHQTLADLVVKHGFTWRYYAVSAGSIWTAPNAIRHLCQPVGPDCTGPAWQANVDVVPSDVLADIANCQLRNLTWVTPTGQNSDHPHGNTGGGPSWVASIVNAIGNSACKDSGTSYWDDTAIIITWDDWGGWYDHVVPPYMAPPQSGYQYGFRVPLIVVSAYTQKGYIDNSQFDFGSIARFVEHNFLVHMGALTFADARTTTDLLKFFDLARSPRAFTTIPAPLSAKHFIEDKTPPLPPDND